MTTKLDINRRQKIRDLVNEARGSVDYTIHLTTALAEVLTEFDIALELLQGCLGDDNGEAYGGISFPLYEGIEKFVGRHRD